MPTGPTGVLIQPYTAIRDTKPTQSSPFGTPTGQLCLFTAYSKLKDTWTSSILWWTSSTSRASSRYGTCTAVRPTVWWEYFSNRSQSWRKLFDPSLGFIRGKDSKGNFRKEYSPFSSSHRADDYCEGNGWQYTWLVPHDFNGLCKCFGGKEKLLEKLDKLFTVSSVVEGEETSPDISGLIGQYAHGNEPSHHILYFYTIAGQPWKTADRVRQVVSELYHAAPDGLSGNEDVGQMSAWYILSNLGFYEVEPGSGRYWFGTPLMDRAEIAVPGGTFTIIARELSDKNRYVQKVFLNGKAYTKSYIPHSDIAAGGELLFVMGREQSW